MHTALHSPCTPSLITCNPTLLSTAFNASRWRRDPHLLSSTAARHLLPTDVLGPVGLRASLSGGRHGPRNRCRLFRPFPLHLDTLCKALFFPRRLYPSSSPPGMTRLSLRETYLPLQLLVPLRLGLPPVLLQRLGRLLRPVVARELANLRREL